MSFVFYDTETTGTDRVFDQILQFAAIRTDEDFQELERFNIRCQLLPHVVPSPGAMRVTGITVAQLLSSELPTHYAMVRAIHEKLLSWSPSLFIGYNSVYFDEHLLRQAFYQTLHGPYLTNTGGNCRADALRMLRATALFAPNTITIPMDETGAPSFKLDRVGPANGFDHSSAHDALGDVEATLHLCHLMSERAPELWSTFVRFTLKAAVLDHVANEEIFCLADFFGGVPYSWIVTQIGPSTSRRSDVLVFDLAVDPDELRPLPPDELAGRLAQFPKAVRRLRTNASPIIVPVEMAPDIAMAKPLDAVELERRSNSVRNDTDFCERLITAFEGTTDEREPWPHVEQQIYDAFISDADERLIDVFHRVPWEQRLPLLDEFEDARLKQLGRRLIFLERPDVLPDHVRQKMTASMARRLIEGDGSGAWLCLQGAIQEADDLISLAPEGERPFLQEHRGFYFRRLAELSRHLA